MVSTSPIPDRRRLTATAVAYRNTDFVAQRVMPYAGVEAESFEWWEWPVDQGFNLPDTRVGRTSRPSMIELTAELRPGATEDWGLDIPVTEKDVRKAQQLGNTYDPYSRATEHGLYIVDFDHEVRTAAAVLDPANYAAGLSQVLGTDDQLDKIDNPLAFLKGLLNLPLIRPNICTMSLATWGVIESMPKLVQQVLGTNTAAGTISREQLAAKLELDEIIVGRSRLNIKRPGQPLQLGSVWGEGISFTWRNPAFAGFDSATMTWGATARYSQRFSFPVEDKDLGVKGGWRIRSGEHSKELVIAKHAGYLLQTPVTLPA